jgi:kynurenine formamidase
MMTEAKRAVSPGLDALIQATAGAEVIDLTVTLAEHLPAAWPSHMPFQRKVYNWYGPQTDQIQPIHGFRGPYHTAWLVLDEHAGTHVDAPAHFVPPPDSPFPLASEMGLETGEKIDLSRLMGPAAVINVSELSSQGENGVSAEITVDHVKRWEAEHGELQPTDIALFRSDWDERYVPMPEGSGYVFDSFILKQGPGWPTPGIPLLEYLINKGVMTIGLDGVSVGPAHAGVPPHQYGLSRGMLYVELLANLRKLPPRGAYFIMLPLKIEGSSAGPGRAIALLPKRGA